ncbi:hypothetical protein KR054_002600, partial [Drosophila jambulina]
SSDSDMEVLGSGDGDQKRIIQGLKRTIKRNQTKINDLAAKLAIAENNLASEREKTKDKEDVIKTLKLSIDVIKENSGQSLKRTDCELHKTKIDELNAYIEILECKLKNRNEKISELEDQTEKYEINLKEKDEHISSLESQIKLSLDTTQKYERNLKEKDEQIAKFESEAKANAAQIKKLNDKLSKFTLEVETSDEDRDTFVYLNCTKMPSIQFVTLPSLPYASRLAAVFEDLPSAGPGWMLIQRRIDGSVVFYGRNHVEQFRNGFGDLSREFWLGLEKLHILTTNQRHELFIELVDFDNATAYARYDHFVVGSEKEKYVIQSVGQYSGNAGNYFGKGCQFTFANDSCSVYGNVGWWAGLLCNLNGKYYDRKTVLETTDGIWWGTWNMGSRHSLKSCKMLIRPKP